MNNSPIKEAQRKSAAFKNSLVVKAQAGVELSSGQPGFDIMGGNAAKDRNRYRQFHGHLYSVINVIAREGAGQPVNIARLSGASEKQFRNTKGVPTSLRRKAVEQEWEMMYSHPFLDTIEKPNPVQSRWQFVYTFIANLNLTGWAYIVGGVSPEGKMEFYSLPSTWVKPLHKDGLFSKFLVGHPNKPDSAKEVLDRDSVAFAFLPDPSDPISGYGPASSQQPAIQIDNYIQDSQSTFFENGVFPSVVVTIGKDPHPDIPGGGIRPRLSPEQRRQITLAIRKTMQGVHNYGNPAIVDGLIERIDRMSATANEMGWKDSEERVRSRILSAFGVHPMLLGEKEVTNYATAYKVEERFFRIVNCYLDMLSSIMTDFAAPFAEGNKRLMVWWEELKAQDESLRVQALKDLRDRDDISRNEYRAEFGFPPVEDVKGERSKLLETVGGMVGTLNITKAVSMFEMPYEAGLNQLIQFLGVDARTAQLMLGPPPMAPEPVELLPAPTSEPETEDETEQEEIEDEMAEDQNPETDDALEPDSTTDASVSLLKMTPEAYAALLHAAAKQAKAE